MTGYWKLPSLEKLNLSQDTGLQGWEFDDPPKYFNQFEFENLDMKYWLEMYAVQWQLAFYFGAAYLLTIYFLQKYMKNRAPFDLKFSLFVWNLGLGIFSLAGFSRMIPAFLDVLLSQDGFFKSICVRVGADKPTAFWYVVFGLSKFVELGDTIFLILKKKPVVLLQWYHHVVTLIAQCLVGPLVEPISRWVVVMNYGVHSLMYNYFALRAVNVHIPNKIANLITTLQLLQMVFGFYINFYSIFLLNQGVQCSRHLMSVKVMGTVYGSFTLLFGKLFYDSVIARKRSTNKKDHAKITEKTD